MSDMSTTSPLMMTLMTAAMMVAMMLPSIAPALWSHHRHLRRTLGDRALRDTALVAVGYASVWAAVGMAISAQTFEWPPIGTRSATAGAVVLLAGLLQRSAWKARRLQRCRDWCTTTDGLSRSAAAALRDGCRLGLDCCLSCAAPMAVLIVAGLMDVRMMVLVTSAIAAERVAPGGIRVASVTGLLGCAAGLMICARALT